MRGLLMIEPLYHQTVKGVKTMTRRSSGLEIVNDCLEENYQPTEWVMEKFNSGKSISVLEFMRPDDRSVVLQCAPRYKVGEVLYLKEPYIIKIVPPPISDIHLPNTEKFVYKFDNEFDLLPIKWSNKLFMPASAARAFIRITSIKCERLLDISDEDCVAEGIENKKFFRFKNESSNKPVYFADRIDFLKYQNYLSKEDDKFTFINPKDSFLSLYKFANKVKDVPNLWVFCYTYELCTKPE